MNDRLLLVVAGWMLLALAAAPDARAQIFSPGDLSRAHKKLDGVTGCMKCHVGDAGGHSDGKCLECHTEIAWRLNTNRGYHADVKSQKCAECHVEHRGEQAKLITWKPAKKSFNHVLTGWPLYGAHKEAKCQECHDVRFIENDNEVVRLIAEGRESYLGVSTACATCHFDEHRGQEGTECQRCHDSTKFDEATFFRHNDPKLSRYALLGEHKKVECKKCHDEQRDNVDLTSFPKPRSQSYLKLKDIPFASCADCHDDTHLGKFGDDCVRCHTADGWKIINDSAEDTGFHDKHAFKLRGAHATVSCRACHGPFAGEAAKFKGMKFQQCADCHFDAHVGQLRTATGVIRCEKCHSVNGFSPVIFTAAMHKDTRFALEGGHQAVACNQCHGADARLLKKLPQKVRNETNRKHRRLLVSDVQLRYSALDVGASGEAPRDLSCAACHGDPHDAQFEAPTVPLAHGSRSKECSTCHTPAGFSDGLKFSHDDSRFPLSGKHQQAACGSCHLASPGKTAGKSVVQYRGLDKECQGCHADLHAGQLAKGGRTDCASCHSTSDFKRGAFNHDKQSAFPLVGRHKDVKCARCHPSAEVRGEGVTRYKPVPTSCDACHDDHHQGAFNSFALNADALRCEGCHSPKGWAPAKFPHERTGFTLTGRHQHTACRACHVLGGKRQVPTTCAGCHADPHAQQFGLMCASCHTTERFEAPAFAVDAHRRTLFPLSGRHVAIPCEECHGEKRDRTFSRAAVDCSSCHGGDARRASLVTVDHQRSPLSTASCRSCHIPSKFTPARLPQHEPCFPIARGTHVRVQCVECHEPAGLAGARVDGDCQGVAVRCVDCHAHSQGLELPRHRKIVGFEYKSAKCAGCHRSP